MTEYSDFSREYYGKNFNDFNGTDNQITGDEKMIGHDLSHLKSINPLTANTIESYKSKMTDNVLWQYSLSGLHDRKLGSQWYRLAHLYAEQLASEHKITISQAAGVIAALSPMTTWQKNKDNAETLISDRNAHIGTFSTSVNKAKAILDGTDPSDILGRKTRSFWHNMTFPNTSDLVTLDIWAIRIVLNDPSLKLDHSRKLVGSNAKYQTISEVYITAGKVLDLRPCDLQAVTWSSYRRFYGKKRNADFS